jgi:Transposase
MVVGVMFSRAAGTRAAVHNRILEEPAMAKARSLVGLDVHAAKIVAAVLDAETGELTFFGFSGETENAAVFCAGLPRPVRVAYEAGPTGYGLARELVTRGVACVVAAPSKIPRASGDRVKTDRRDAELIVRMLFAGKLHAVRVPGAEEEALRDLVRAREQVRVDLMRCRHRLSKLLLRHGIRFEDGDAWTDRHRAWLNTVELDWPAAQAAPGRASSNAGSVARSSRSPQPANSPDSAGRSPKSSETARSQPPNIPSAGSVAARHARGTRDTPPSNRPPPATLAFRQRLPTTNHGPASPSTQPAHTSLTRVAHNKPDRHPPNRPHLTSSHPNQRKQETRDATLDTRPSISGVGRWRPGDGSLS